MEMHFAWTKPAWWTAVHTTRITAYGVMGRLVRVAKTGCSEAGGSGIWPAAKPWGVAWRSCQRTHVSADPDPGVIEEMDQAPVVHSLGSDRRQQVESSALAENAFGPPIQPDERRAGNPHMKGQIDGTLGIGAEVVHGDRMDGD